MRLELSVMLWLDWYWALTAASASRQKGPSIAPWSETDPVEAGWVTAGEAVIYNLCGCAAACVYHRRCSNSACTERRQYDGYEDGVFNYSNRSLFTYELCFNYADGMVVSRLPFATHWQLLRKNYTRAAQGHLLCARGTHRRAMLEFIRLIDVDYAKAFTCQLCAQLAHDQLVFIIDGKEMGMNPDEWEDLLVHAAKLPGLADALRGVLERYPGDDTARMQCPLELRPLFKSMAKNYPASGMLTPSYACDRFQRLIRGNNRSITAERKRILAEGFPALHEVVSSCGWTRLPSFLLEMLQGVATKAAIPGRCPEVGEVHVTNAMAELDHVYMPAFPLCRDLPIFEASSQKSVDGESCSKFHRYHNQLTPGIFTFFCAHGLCVGFKFMVNKEGPATAFELFLTRLQAGPKMVVYDNACNLHRYALRRAPKFFADTAFRIDRLHIYNHHGCSSGYNLAKYPQDMQLVDGMPLRKLNTQVAEQCNSILDRVRTQVAYMLHDNGMDYLKYFLACSNEVVRNR
ncbi:hypothetical protein WJX75_000796 [Coccomyxa subellipsoidea]|uniref:HMG domain-containing protein n=1 Tax=Coccomyxa subellipsoidea TaxID=248742 RepID=A0ABR2Z0G5_9CHLO